MSLVIALTLMAQATTSIAYTIEGKQDKALSGHPFKAKQQKKNSKARGKSHNLKNVSDDTSDKGASQAIAGDKSRFRDKKNSHKEAKSELRLESASEKQNLTRSGGKVPQAKVTSSVRLPRFVRPFKYAITVEPDLVEGTFKGHEKISVVLSKPVSAITVNSLDLTVEKVAIRGEEGEETSPIQARVSINPHLQQATFDFGRKLEAGRYEISVAFKGCFNEKLRGFYRAYYTDENGGKQILAATQMEPTEARRMFPCFDEPDFKASYQITAIVDSDLKAVSNAEVQSEREDATRNKKIITFAPTPKMSTYLICLVIGKLEATPAIFSAGIPIRVWSVRGKSAMGKFAQDVASRLMTYYHSYFHIRYMAQKLDLIAIPDFEAGAMENVGAITFKEQLLLLSDKASARDRQWVAGVVAHEMAHLWFGDLVTMKWWDDIWLNEAFATWMSCKAIDNLFPEWHACDEFGVHLDDHHNEVMETDAMLSTRPIHFHVVEPADVNEMFDEITYEKGASILRMLEQFVSDRVFQAGVDRYLRLHAYGNATTADLWQAVQAVSGRPIVQLMKNWVNEPGYPKVSVEFFQDAVKNIKKMKLTQERFLLDSPLKPKAAGKPVVWFVPVSIKTWSGKSGFAGDVNSVSTKLLETKELVFPMGGKIKQFLANASGYGYFVTGYQSADLRALEPLIQTKLQGKERRDLLRDQWYQLKASQIPVAQYLDLTSFYQSETEPAPTQQLLSQFHALSNFIEPANRPAFAKLVQSRLSAIKARLGWTAASGESEQVRILRGQVIECLGTIGQDDDTINRAKDLFRMYQADYTAVDSDLIDAITYVVAYNGDAEDYRAIKQLWQSAKNPQDEQRNLMALGLFRTPDLLKQTLDLAISDDVHKQDGPRLMVNIFDRNPERLLAWQFFKKNWNVMLSKWSVFALPHVVERMVWFNLPQQEADLRTFFAAHPVPAGTSDVKRMLERVRVNVRFVQDNGQELQEYLESTLRSST
jgi:puromycin-sensitive aminopeptidase